MSMALQRKSSGKVFWHSELKTGWEGDPMSRRQCRQSPGESEKRTPSQERVSHQSLWTKEKFLPHRRSLGHISRVGETTQSSCFSHYHPAPELQKKLLNVTNMGKALAEILVLFSFKEATQERSLTSPVNVEKASVSTPILLPT